MNFKLKATVMKVGNSLALTLPVTLCENFNIEKGQVLEIIYTQQGLLIPEKQKKIFSKQHLRKEKKKKVVKRY